MTDSTWPELPLAEWRDTKDTLHMWTQIVGKIRLSATPLVNHCWNVSLYVTPRGLSTSIMPHGPTAFEIEFDFVDHRLVVRRSDGADGGFALRAQSVADFYRETMSTLERLGLDVEIWTMPVEVEDPIRFEDDTKHASYDPEYVARFHKVLVQSDALLAGWDRKSLERA